MLLADSTIGRVKQDMTEVAARSRRRRSLLFGRVVVFWCCYIAILVLAARVKAMVPQRWGQLVWGIASAAAILPLTLLFLRRENRSVCDIGLNLEPTSALRFVAGIFVGLGVYGLNVILVTVLGSPIHFAWADDAEPRTTALTLSTLVALSCMEELGFRGYPLRTLVPAFGLWQAQGMVAVAFGLCHFAFGWSWATILLGVVPGALLFGMAAVASRGLALPIGIHAGLNFARWSVENNGIWTLVVDEQALARIATVAPITGVAVTVLTTLGFWRWYQAGRNGTGVADAYPGAPDVTSKTEPSGEKV
jgi:membrane protease YdiL (CAAX protease family)